MRGTLAKPGQKARVHGAARRPRAAFAALCLCLALSAALPGPAVAETVSVTGVAQDDVLNLRAEPSASAAIVGALPPGLRGVEIERRSGAWAYVRYKDRAGWASASYLQPLPSSGASLPPLPLRCLGTEPFWSLRVDTSGLLYDRMDHPKELGGVSIARQTGDMDAWQLTPHSGSLASLVVKNEGKACSDGMSDRAYPLAVTLAGKDGQTLHGCCVPAQ